MKIREIWKKEMGEKEIEKEEKILTGKKIGLDEHATNKTILTPTEALNKIEKDGEKKYPAYLTDKEATEQGKGTSGAIEQLKNDIKYLKALLDVAEQDKKNEEYKNTLKKKIEDTTNKIEMLIQNN